MLNMVFGAAFDGDLPRFKNLLMMLDMGRGRLKEAVEALRVEDAGMLQGLGALHVAAGRERLEVCKYLVEELQVDVDGVDKGGKTPLFFVILCKHVGIAKYLLDHGANPNKVNSDGISPLHQATISGDRETVKLLLAKGAYIDPVAFCGTPLHCAAANGDADIMKILLDHNADCNKLVNGQTPLIAAVGGASMNCMLLLLKAGADHKAALTHSLKNLHSEKLVSTDFVNCLMEDISASHFPDDDEPMSKRKIRAAGFKKIANVAFKTEQYLCAAKCYTMAIRFDPNNATLYSNRSLCWLRMGEGDKALWDANQCRKLLLDWPKAFYRQGAALMLLKDYKGASEHFLDGLKLDPANTEMEDALRKAYDAMKDVSKHQG
ncbi:ankyrin-1-like [Triticum dicoccoides]|uniref:ankyrin-1-like n=1 Tax=Triticum dicoccoides TaxID=85692 RepID=UPI001890A418|nr:ankyrin-1-like [Triticum dicoccoides]